MTFFEPQSQIFQHGPEPGNTDGNPSLALQAITQLSQGQIRLLPDYLSQILFRIRVDSATRATLAALRPFHQPRSVQRRRYLSRPTLAHPKALRQFDQRTFALSMRFQ